MQKRQWTPVTKIIFFGILGVGFILMAGIIAISSSTGSGDDNDDTTTITRDSYEHDWKMIGHHHGMDAETAATISLKSCRAKDDGDSDNEIRIHMLIEHSKEDGRDVRKAVKTGINVSENDASCA